MGKMLEHHSKKLVEEAGLKVPTNFVASTPEEVREHVADLGGEAVLKALVPIGKRGKAGAIKFVSSPEEGAEQAKELLGMEVSHFPVEQILVEEKISIARELYASITLDKNLKAPVVIAGAEGGVDVEEFSRKSPKNMTTWAVDPFRGLLGYEAKQIWSELGLEGKALNLATGALTKLYQVFARYDATILEVNPLVLTSEGEMVVCATVMAVDDSAMYRHPELADKVQIGSERAWRPLTELEKRMVEVNEADPYRGTARYTEMDGGEIGFFCGGGGGSLLSFDALRNFGGAPANYSEVGGNPSEEKAYGLTKGILSKEGVKGLFVAHNITNNTQVDVLAKGIVRALADMGIDTSTFPVVVREAGVNDADAKTIFQAAGIEYYGDDVTISEAAGKMVQRLHASE